MVPVNAVLDTRYDQLSHITVGTQGDGICVSWIIPPSDVAGLYQATHSHQGIVTIPPNHWSTIPTHWHLQCWRRRVPNP